MALKILEFDFLGRSLRSLMRLMLFCYIYKNIFSSLTKAYCLGSQESGRGQEGGGRQAQGRQEDRQGRQEEVDHHGPED